MIAKDSFIILQSGTELTGALCRVGLKSREVSEDVYKRQAGNCSGPS